MAMTEGLLQISKQGRYSEVVEAWCDRQSDDQFNEWDYIAIMNSFYKLQQYKECLELYKIFRKVYPTSDKLDDKLGWAYYQSDFKGYFENQSQPLSTDSTDRLIKQVDYVLSHCSDTSYSPKWCFVRFMMKAIDKNLLPDPDHTLLEHYLNAVDPATLSTQEQTTLSANGKTIYISSDQESWYTAKSKNTYDLGKFDECIAVCDEALKSLHHFHNNNDSWFKYRKANSLYALGQCNEPKLLVLSILKTGFSHWCLYSLLFELERTEGDKGNVLEYIGACSLCDSEHRMRVGIYSEFADFLDSIDMNQEATLHRRLVVLLREENDWRLKAREAEWNFPEDIQSMSKEDVLKKLIPFWKAQRDKNKKFYTGTISNLLSEGRSGFISADTGDNYYFNVHDFINKRISPAVGMNVRFTLIERLDKSKGIYKLNAVEINEVQ